MSDVVDSLLTLLPMILVVGAIVAVFIYIIKHPEQL